MILVSYVSHWSDVEYLTLKKH